MTNTVNIGNTAKNMKKRNNNSIKDNKEIQAVDLKDSKVFPVPILEVVKIIRIFSNRCLADLEVVSTEIRGVVLQENLKVRMFMLN